MKESLMTSIRSNRRTRSMPVATIVATCSLLAAGTTAAHAADRSAPATSSVEASGAIEAISDAAPAVVLESTADAEVMSDGGTLTTARSGGAIEVPATGKTPVEVLAPTGAVVGISAAAVPDDAKARVVDGMTVFDLGDHSVTYQPVAEEAGGGIRTLFTIEEASSPTSFRVDYDLPEGSHFAPTNGGGYIVADSLDRPVGVVPAPWAKDANGTTVATEYELIGDSLIQHVRTTPETAFPVVADPWWIPAWAVAQIIRCGAGGYLGYIAAAGWKWYSRALSVVGGCLIGMR